MALRCFQIAAFSPVLFFFAFLIKPTDTCWGRRCWSRLLKHLSNLYGSSSYCNHKFIIFPQLEFVFLLPPSWDYSFCTFVCMFVAIRNFQVLVYPPYSLCTLRIPFVPSVFLLYPSFCTLCIPFALLSVCLLLLEIFRSSCTLRYCNWNFVT